METQAQVHDGLEEHPLSGLSESVQKRMQRITQAKSFDGELSRRELRDEVYPAISQLVDFCLELEERLGAIEEGEAIEGIPSDLAQKILFALARSALCADLATKYIPKNIEEYSVAKEAQVWLAENIPSLTKEIQDITLPSEGDDDERE